MHRFSDPRVKEVFDAYPEEVREKLLALRELIFETARQTQGVGALDETLRWGQPSYLTVATKSGSTIRIGKKGATPAAYAIYFHCQTDLVDTFRKKYGVLFSYEGNRCLFFSVNETLPVKEVSECIARALTYHLAKKVRRATA